MKRFFQYLVSLWDRHVLCIEYPRDRIRRATEAYLNAPERLEALGQ